MSGTAECRQVDDAVRTVIENPPVDFDAVVHRAQDVDDGAPDGRLAAARLADQAKRLAALQRQRHAVDGRTSPSSAG